ncbi:hypothetical protein [Plesiomonas sp.]|uniref:hypothetical protein n=1 Tax=Plesiomonas sp. TaxID=2486279 RepID=UPI003F68049F
MNEVLATDIAPFALLTWQDNTTGALAPVVITRLCVQTLQRINPAVTVQIVAIA